MNKNPTTEEIGIATRFASRILQASPYTEDVKDIIFELASLIEGKQTALQSQQEEIERLKNIISLNGWEDSDPLI